MSLKVKKFPRLFTAPPALWFQLKLSNMANKKSVIISLAYRFWCEQEHTKSKSHSQKKNPCVPEIDSCVDVNLRRIFLQSYELSYTWTMTTFWKVNNRSKMSERDAIRYNNEDKKFCSLKRKKIVYSNGPGYQVEQFAEGKI